MTPMYSRDQLVNSSGTMLTKGLIYEAVGHTPTTLFTMKADDHEGYVSLRKIFLMLAVDDPSEVTFAEAVFGDYAYWSKFSNSQFVQPYVAEWRQVADVKRKSKAFQAIIDEVNSKGRNSYQASKFLIDEPWKEKTKAQKTKIKETTSEAADLYSEDIERLKDLI